MKTQTLPTRPLRPLGFALGLAVLLAGFASPTWANGAYLGVQLQELSEALVEAFDLEEDAGGVLVTEVLDDSPAESAGLRRGDLIIELDGDAVTSVSSFTRDIRRMDPDDEVTLRVVRKGENETFTITLDEAPSRTRSWTGRGGNSFWLDDDDHDGDGLSIFVRSRGTLGVRVEKMNEDLGRYFGTDQGLLVLEVFEDSGAEDAGMQVGDVIVGADTKDVADIDDLHAVLDDYDEGETVAVTVRRDGQTKDLDVEVRDNTPEFSMNSFPRIFDPHHGRHGNEFFSPRRGQGRDMLRFRGRNSDLEDEMQDLRDELRELREKVKELSEG